MPDHISPYRHSSDVIQWPVRTQFFSQYQQSGYTGGCGATGGCGGEGVQQPVFQQWERRHEYRAVRKEVRKDKKSTLYKPTFWLAEELRLQLRVPLQNKCLSSFGDPELHDKYAKSQRMRSESSSPSWLFTWYVQSSQTCDISSTLWEGCLKC